MKAQAEGHEVFLQRRALRALAKRLPHATVRRALVAREGRREGLLVATDEHLAWVRRGVRTRVTVVARQAARLDAKEQGAMALLRIRGGRREVVVAAPARRVARLLAYCEGKETESASKPERSDTIARLLEQGSMSRGEAEWARR